MGVELVETHPSGGDNLWKSFSDGIGGFGGAKFVSSSAGFPGLWQVAVGIGWSSNLPGCPMAGFDWTGDNGAEPSCLSATV